MDDSVRKRIGDEARPAFYVAFMMIDTRGDRRTDIDQIFSLMSELDDLDVAYQVQKTKSGVVEDYEIVVPIENKPVLTLLCRSVATSAGTSRGHTVWIPSR